MQTLTYDIAVESRKTEFVLYPIGDIHLGANDVAENKLRKLVNKIRANPNARWIGGGDYCECIKPSDTKRWDVESLPDWMFEGDAKAVKDRLRDVVSQQKNRFYKIFKPIKDKCIGLIEGNHETNVRKYHDIDHHGFMCNEMGVPDLQAEAFVTLRFIRQGSAVRIITIFVCHGAGGGRRLGAASNKLEDIAAFVRANIILMGHTHQFTITSPLVELGPAAKGDEECVQYLKYAANWGTWRLSYKAGSSTYTSRALYRPRPLSAVEIGIIPFRASTAKKDEVVIQLREVSL
jgi:predicted phosphodiesterase